jgi:hypothetical protein
MASQRQREAMNASYVIRVQSNRIARKAAGIFSAIMQTDFDRVVKRVESLYGEQRQQPNIPPVYLVTPPTPKASELDHTCGLVLAFLLELPDLALTLVALAVAGLRHAWRWLRSWKRKGPRIKGQRAGRAESMKVPR